MLTLPMMWPARWGSCVATFAILPALLFVVPPSSYSLLRQMLREVSQTIPPFVDLGLVAVARVVIYSNAPRLHPTFFVPRPQLRLCDLAIKHCVVHEVVAQHQLSLEHFEQNVTDAQQQHTAASLGGALGTTPREDMP